MTLKLSSVLVFPHVCKEIYNVHCRLYYVMTANGFITLTDICAVNKKSILIS